MPEQNITNTDLGLLKTIAGLDGIPSVGAYNLRLNSGSAGRRSTKNIEITPKTDRPGIDIRVKPGVKDEDVHIPVIIDASGIAETVYNDFFVGEGADVTIIAGCGIHNDGCEESRHDGVHRFFIGRDAKVRYIERHYGEGGGTGGRVMNPATEVYMEEGSSLEMETVQIGGIDSTVRKTLARLGDGCRMNLSERLMTHGSQTAESDVVVELNGRDSSAGIMSRTVAKDDSTQVFRPRAVGRNACRAHVRCDSIIMDRAKVSSVPEIAAESADAQLVHEAAIGRINNEQLLKLMTLGIDEERAEEIIVEGFLS